jgi:hypothetical protein
MSLQEMGTKEKVLNFGWPVLINLFTMRYRVTIILLASLVIMASASCKRNHYKVDTSSINVNIRIKRLEKDIFSLDPAEIPGEVPLLREKYRGFLQLFSYVINTGDINDPGFGDYLIRFCTDKLNNEVYDTVMKKYPDVGWLEQDLQEAFRHYLYYFPGKNVPAVYTCITGFNNSIIVGDSALGIGLDRYLGAGSGFYRRLQIYKYMAERMTGSNIVPDCIYGWGTSEWDFESLKYPADNVLSEIIHEGKLKYFEKCMLPGTPDKLIFGFTDDQLKFCRNNEAQMWQYLIEEKLLFSTDKFTIRKLTGEAPFTSYFTNESPGRAAVWLGFRIVESYMMKNPGISLGVLMKDTGIQSILEKAKYSPQ